MPFLRFAIYKQLLKAEGLLPNRRERPGRRVRDLDLDGRPEVKLHNSALNAYLKPDRGGALYELDDRERGWNLTAVMTRRPEATHGNWWKPCGPGRPSSLQPANARRASTTGCAARSRGWRSSCNTTPTSGNRCSTISTRPMPTSAALRRSEVAEWGDFIGAPYELKAPPSRSSSVTLSRSGLAGPPGRKTPVHLSKRISLGEGGALEARYALGFPEGAPPGTVFAVEFNFGLMAGNAPDRNYFSAAGENLGNLSTLLCRAEEAALGLVDEWLGVAIRVQASPAAAFWAYPVETVNDSEGGFERVYQGSAVRRIGR